MARKKKVIAVTFEEKIIEIAREYVTGAYGSGVASRQKINALGYGNIYSSVKKYANMITAGQL